MNHYIHDFEHEEWDAKKHHFQLTASLIPNVKVCRVYAGLFLEDSIGPWFGFDTKNGTYEAVGDPTRRCSYTSIFDVGKAVALLASMPVSEVPAEVQLAGDSRSFNEVADIMESAGGGDIEVTSIDLAQYKRDVIARPSPTPERYLRFLMGEGKIDHSDAGLGSQNALIENEADFGGWTTISDLAKETNGRPWGNEEWPAAT